MLEEGSLVELTIEVFQGKMGRESQLQKRCRVQQTELVRQSLEARGCWKRLAGQEDPSWSLCCVAQARTDRLLS
jgi:hypothetical protein